MNKALRRNLFLRVAVMCLAIAVLQGCGTNQGQLSPSGPALSWDSPKMRQIKAEWQSLQQTYDRNPEKIPGKYGKIKYGNLLRMCDRLLRKRLSDQDLRELTSSCHTLPIRDADRDFFDNEVLGFMVRAFVATGDRDSLVKLLSTRGTRSVVGGWLTPVEYYLASQAGRNLGFRLVKLKDPILVLGDAYAECSIPEVREELAFAAHRGFDGLGISGKDEADFIRNAMQWYTTEKDRVVANSSYVRQQWCVDMPRVSAEEYDRQMSTLSPRELLFREKQREPWAEKFGFPFPILPIWGVHAAIAVVLTAPIVFFGRKRLRWKWWELLAFVLPFAVWAILMSSELAEERKTVWNIPEGLYFAVAVPLAALVRVAVGSRRREPVWAAALLVALCAIAAAVFFLVPPWPGPIPL